MNKRLLPETIAICTLISTILTGCTFPADLASLTNSSGSTSSSSSTTNTVPTSKAKVTDIYPETNYQLTSALPTAIRYTVRENGVCKSYITEDTQLIEQIVESLNNITLDLTKQMPPISNRSQIVLCGPSDWGNIPYAAIDMADGFFITDSLCYSANGSDDLKKCLEKVIETGVEYDYDFETDENLSAYDGYWGCDNKEFSIFIDENGTWGINFFTFVKDSNDLESSESYIIASIDGNTFTLIDEDGNTKEIVIEINGNNLVYDGDSYHRYMTE